MWDNSTCEFQSQMTFRLFTAFLIAVSLIPLSFPANYVGGIVPLTLRASLLLLSARVTIASGISETKIFVSLEACKNQVSLNILFTTST
jgi:hypothetical protein